jgi:hypothetical protein
LPYYRALDPCEVESRVRPSESHSLRTVVALSRVLDSSLKVSDAHVLAALSL